MTFRLTYSSINTWADRSTLGVHFNRRRLLYARRHSELTTIREEYK